MTSFTRILFLRLLPVLLSFPAFGQWIQQPFPYSDALWKVRFVNSTTGWILGQHCIYKTSDGGTTWTSQDSTADNGTLLAALSSDTVLYSSFTFGGAPNTRGLKRSSDGGTTWNIVDSISMLWNEMKFLDHRVGYAAGGTVPDFHPIVRKTTDGGASWATTWTGGGNYEVEGLHFFDPSHGWLTTWDGAILESTDGGFNWIVRDSIQTQLLPVHDMTFASLDRGWAVGGISGTSLIVRTTDAGLHWGVQTFPGSTLEEVKFFNTHLGWFVGTNNRPPYIARTSDGGETWVTQSLVPSANGPESFSMVDTTLGWAVNHQGNVFRTTNGGLTFVLPGTDDVPASFALYQNYPNPFNPITTIRFSVRRPSTVTLTVVDILGREIATLAAGKHQPGTYSAKWDASNTSSGVYFCRMVADGFVAVTAMLTVK